MSKRWKKPVFLIDNGHGIDTAGKESPDASLGLLDSPYYFREYAYAREIACGLVDVLTLSGVTAHLLVPELEDISLQERTRRIKAYCRKYGTENVVVVSIHVNAAKSDRKWHDARGWCCYTSPGKTASDDLATCLYEAAEDELVKRSYGHPYGNTFGPGKQKPIRSDWSDGDPDHEAKFWMLTQHPATAVLSENMFQDTKADVAWLLTDEGKGAIINLHLEGILNYIKTSGRWPGALTAA